MLWWRANQGSRGQKRTTARRTRLGSRHVVFPPRSWPLYPPIVGHRPLPPKARGAACPSLGGASIPPRHLPPELDGANDVPAYWPSNTVDFDVSAIRRSDAF